jgi:chorismate dehydratase
MGRTIVIGTVPFVNGRPLTWGLEEEPGVEVCRVVPSQMPALLRTGRLDAALLPTIAYFRLTADTGERARAARDQPLRPARAPTAFVALRAGAIASRGPVGSARLMGWTDVEKVRRVLLDPASRTSNALARVLLVRQYGLRPHFVLPEDGGAAGAKPEARPPDAEVVIGDRGLRRQSSLGLAPAWDRDLGQEWDHFVHKPFVYAFWVARRESATASLESLLEAARERGLKAREEVAEDAAKETGIPLEVVRRHLVEEVHFGFGPREVKGLLAFYAMAAEEGLAPPGGRLRFGPDGPEEPPSGTEAP